MIVSGNRASALLFNFLKSLKKTGVFLLPSNICPIVPLTLTKAQREFELIDISLDTFCMDESILLEKLNNSKYAGVLFVRTYGTPQCFEKLFNNIKKANQDIAVIDDNCLGIPSFIETDTQADMVLFSTGYSKIVDLGFGGYAVIKGNDYKTYKNNPMEQNLSESIKEYKSFNEYKSAVLNEVERIKKHKKRLNQIYTSSLPKEIQLPAEYQHWRFNILVPQKDKLLEEIFAQGLFASSHYAPFKKGGIEGNFPNTEYLHSRVINLFNDKYFDEDKAVKICQIINDHMSTNCS